MAVGFIEGLLRMDTKCTLEDWVPSSTVVLFLFSCNVILTSLIYPLDAVVFGHLKLCAAVLQSFSLGLGSTLQWDHSRQSVSLQAQQLKEGHLWKQCLLGNTNLIFFSRGKYNGSGLYWLQRRTRKDTVIERNIVLLSGKSIEYDSASDGLFEPVTTSVTSTG